MRRNLPEINGQKAQVYRNLNQNCLSIMEKGKVTGHANIVLLKDVEFRVRETGRQKVLREKRKNVHAFAFGKIESCSNQENINTENLTPISYNPYYSGSFYRKDNLQPVKYAEQAIVTRYGIFSYNCA